LVDVVWHSHGLIGVHVECDLVTWPSRVCMREGGAGQSWQPVTWPTWVCERAEGGASAEAEISNVLLD
jgi:hypothetical protein